MQLVEKVWKGRGKRGEWLKNPLAFGVFLGALTGTGGRAGKAKEAEAIAPDTGNPGVLDFQQKMRSGRGTVGEVLAKSVGIGR
jgi:hypothetical protein